MRKVVLQEFVSIDGMAAGPNDRQRRSGIAYMSVEDTHLPR